MKFAEPEARHVQALVPRGLDEGNPAAATIPEKVGYDWCLALLIFFLTVAYLRVFYNYTFCDIDEGIVLQGAQRILEGEVPHRDFFSYFTPGSYYWLALFFKMFGSSILVGRAVLMAEGGIFSVLTYLLARRVCSRWNALLAAYFVTLSCLPCRFVVLHNWDSTLWACLAVYFAVRFLERPRAAWAMTVGLFASLTCLFEQSKGAGLILGLVAGFSILALTSRHFREGQDTARGAKTPAGPVVPTLWNRQRVAALLAGFLGPFLITIAYFSMKHGLPQFMADSFWPLHHYAAVNKIPIGFLPEWKDLYAGGLLSFLLALLITGPCYVVPVLSVLTVFGLTFWSLRAWQEGPADGRVRYYVLISATLAGLVIATLLTGRPDLAHLVYLSPLVLLMLAWILEGRDIPSSLLQAVKPVLVLILLLSFTAFGMAFLWQPLNARQKLETRRGTLKTNGSDQVLDYVQARVAAGETMLVYPYLPLYYYLTATRSPFRYEHMILGFHSPQQYQQLVRELAAGRPRVVLFEPSFPEKMTRWYPAATPALLAVPDPVEEYIATHYRVCASLTTQNFWRFAFMIRKDLACPGR